MTCYNLAFLTCCFMIALWMKWQFPFFLMIYYGFSFFFFSYTETLMTYFFRILAYVIKKAHHNV